MDQPPTDRRVIDVDQIDRRARYQLLTSLVVPRPIAWVSTWDEDGSGNLAPFSYFAGVSSTPLLVAVSIGHRRSGPKDTLVNIRRTGAFCVNVVPESLIEAMNSSSGEYPPRVDEFEVAGLAKATASSVNAPYVAEAPAVLECKLYKEVDLDGAPNTLVLGEVRVVRVAEDLSWIEDSHFVDTTTLRPVGRLWGTTYTLLGDIQSHDRPVVD